MAPLACLARFCSSRFRDRRSIFVFIVMQDLGVGGSPEARPADPTVADGHRAAGEDALQSHENKAEAKSNRR
jgi:hypothetical protein